MIQHLRIGIVALVLSVAIATAPARSATTLPATAPATTQPTTLDLPTAAKALTDFAAWCAANKARTQGEAALVLARRIIDPPEGADAIRYAFKTAADSETGTPAVVKAQQAAIDKATHILLAMAAEPHEEADDAKHDWYLLKALQISPSVPVAEVEKAVARASDAPKPDMLADWYAVLLRRDAKWASNLEAKLVAKSALPDAAKKAVSEFLTADRGFDALTYLQQLTKVDPKGFAAGAYQPCTDVLAARTFLVRAEDHAMVAYVSIPWKWNPIRTAPVIFCFAGAGKEYKGVSDAFHNVVGDGPYVVVSPVTFSNTNSVNVEAYLQWYSADVVKPYVSGQLNAGTIAQRLQFDLPGVLALFKSMRTAANLESQMYITGFSGGGIPCYAMMIHNPDLIAAGAPACANYYLNLVPRGNAKGTFVQQLFGEKDGYNAAIGTGPGLFAQGREASGVLSGMGYEVAEPFIVSGSGHGELATQVVRFFGMAKGKQRRGN